jgi:hypothetical protein
MLLGKVFESLAPSGQFVILGVMPNPDRITPFQPVFFPIQMLRSLLRWMRMAKAFCSWASVKIAPARARLAFLAARPAQESGKKGRRHVDNVPTKESLWQSWTF